MTGTSKTRSSVLAMDMVLSVSPIQEDHAALERIFSGSRHPATPESSWHLRQTATVPSALKRLKESLHALVICERDLPLGDWKDLLEHSQKLADPPFLIVTSRHADDYLWAEALNLGAYDVLCKPFSSSEVMRVVSEALQRWKREHRPNPEHWNASVARCA